MQVRLASQEDETAWDDYAERRGTIFHRFQWARIVEQGYGHTPLYMIAEDAGQIYGILPIFDRKSALFGRALISVAHTTGGGLLADNENAARALAQRAVEEARARGAKYVELRGDADLGEEWLTKSDQYKAFSIPIIEDEEARLKSIPRKKRADIRKGIAAAKRGELVADISQDVDAFWRGFVRAQRDLGTPAPPRAWFDAQLEHLPGKVEIVTLSSGDRTVASVLSYYHRDRVTLYSAYITPAARTLHAGDYLYWWMMGHALTRGASIFDLGRSKPGTGSHAYKMHWGIRPEALIYRYYLLEGEVMPNVNPRNPKFAAFAAGWRHMPLPLARLVGPLLSRHLS